MSKRRERPARRAQPRRPAERPEVEIAIDALGGGGDGIGMAGGRRVFVPFAAPGDRVRARLGEPLGDDAVRGEFLELVAAGPHRQAPLCAHFGPCGACPMQHLDGPTYAAWKRDLLVRALARAGIAIDVDPLTATPPGSRRRATLAARRGRAVFLGFNERQSTRIVDLVHCAVLRPEIMALLPPLRAVLADTLAEGEGLDAAITLLDDGLDLVLVSPRAPGLAARERLADFAEAQDLARLSWQEGGAPPEPIAHRQAGVVRFGGVAVTLPPGGFLQPSREGEAALTALAIEGVGAAARVADLFSGAGTFALPLSAKAQVMAVDGDVPAVAALTAAVRGAGRADRLTAQRRDLHRDPLTAKELAGFDAVVFDPPRAGAREQAVALAASPVPTVVAVSCNPATLSRDAAILAAGGYRAERATPVDQFLWSTHLEAVVVFRR